ncbi:MAG: ABC transporter ATP-binding protein [Lachnospiraceae bacterium]
MAKIEETFSLKQALRLHLWAAKIWWKIQPSLFLSTGLFALCETLTPYVTIWLSAQIINELSGRRNAAVLWQLVVVTVFTTAVLSVLSACLKRWREAVHGAESEYEDRLYIEKLTDMDYAAAESAATKDILLEMKYHMQGNVYGFTKIHYWYFERIVKGLASVGATTALCVSLFTKQVPQSAGSLVLLNHPLATLILIAVLLGGILLTPMLSAKANTCYDKMWPYNNRYNRWCNSFLYIGLKRERSLDVRMYNQQNMVKENMQKYETMLPGAPVTKLYQGPLGLYSAASALSGVALIGIVYAFVCLKALGGAFGIGSVTQYVGAITALCSGITELADVLSDCRTNAGFLDAIRKYLDIPNDMYRGSLTTEKRTDRQYEVEFQDVSFRYPGSDTWALRHVSMKFKLGSRLAIVGENGSGKSTFIKLLCRLYDATEGTILLNGIDIRKYRLKEYMDIFSVVFQDFRLLAQPIGANVAGSRAYDKERVLQCLKDAGFEERLALMPKGLGTCLYKTLEKDGVEISGGEAQKIAIARALYKDAPFIILDEPTAALDPIAEAEIYSKFNDIAGDKTAIYISHRLSSCKFCDEIAVFHDGAVVEQGTHKELLANKNGKYYELWNAQAQYYTREEHVSEHELSTSDLP